MEDDKETDKFNENGAKKLGAGQQMLCVQLLLRPENTHEDLETREREINRVCSNYTDKSETEIQHEMGATS